MVLFEIKDDGFAKDKNKKSNAAGKGFPGPNSPLIRFSYFYR
jgi:hypothetical protein